jgi:heme exporter protein C
MRRGDLAFTTLAAATAVLFAGLFSYVFFAVPTAQPAAGGLAQKIFYFHVPSAYALYLSGTVCFAASIAYLLRETEVRNALARAGAECAVLFGLIVLTSGPLWAKKAWGVYWTWDPRLTTSLLSVLIYVSIVVLRAFAGDGSAERKFSATIGVLGWFNLFIIHFSVQKWGGNHPTVIGRGGGGLQDVAMKYALFGGFIAITALAVVLLWWRARVLIADAKVRELELTARDAGLLEDAG